MLKTNTKDLLPFSQKKRTHDQLEDSDNSADLPIHTRRLEKTRKYWRSISANEKKLMKIKASDAYFEFINDHFSSRHFNLKEQAFLNIYIHLKIHLEFEFEACMADLYILNSLIKSQWEKDNPGQAFPIIKEGIHFSFDESQDLVLSKPAKDTLDLQAVKLNRVLLKTIIKYIQKKGLHVNNNDQNFTDYLKFIGAIPNKVANFYILLDNLKFFTEGVTTPYHHGNLSHYIQIYLAVCAFEKYSVSLRDSGFSFTPKEFFEMLFSSTFQTDDQYSSFFSLWGYLFDIYNAQENNPLEFVHPEDIQAIIRESFNNEGLSVLSRCLIISELKRLIKFSTITHEPCLQICYQQSINAGPRSDDAITKKEIEYRWNFLKNNKPLKFEINDNGMVYTKRLTL